MQLGGVTMQVGLQTTTRSAGGELAPPQIGDPLRVPPIPRRAGREEYPASPLLSIRPQRYSVQLNDQLTALQQADSYLSRLEKALLDHRYATSGGRRGGESEALQDLLINRVQLSAGRIDRQLLPVLQGEPQVIFHAPALAALLEESSQTVSLMFSADAEGGRRLAAVSLANPADTLNPLMQIKHALQRTGIMPRYGEGGWTFATAEAGWSQIQRSFTVADAQGAHPERPVLHAEPALSEALGAALETGSRDGLQGRVQSLLGQVGEQRQLLSSAQERARQRMDEMARIPDAQGAERASAALGQTLAWVGHDYATLAQAVNGQANLPALTVQNLLG